MKKLIIASNNAHKIDEIKQILKGIHLNILSLKECNIGIDVEENGKTFQENSYKKAKEIMNHLINRGDSNFIVMADDSGLEIEYLNGEPGVYSARYSGKHGDDSENNKLVLEKLKGVSKENRKASFVCYITLLSSDGKEIGVEGRAYGRIIEELKGKKGFGYDPLFYVDKSGKTFAEMSQDEKNKISHRGVALDKIRNRINELI